MPHVDLGLAALEYFNCLDYSTVSKMVVQLSEATIWLRRPLYYTKFSQTELEIQITQNKLFDNITRFPRIIGALDYIYIKIQFSY